MGNSITKEANSNKKIVSEFVRARGADAIPRMSRMLYIDRSITDINVKDSDYGDWTALHYQAGNGTTGSVAWLLRQDPPPDIDVRSAQPIRMKTQKAKSASCWTMAPIEILRTSTVVLLCTMLDGTISLLQLSICWRITAPTLAGKIIYIYIYIYKL